ncbi:MAG: hypothetical protein ACFFG0_33615 [Candidatus Thorarchaeota archaeon]
MPEEIRKGFRLIYEGKEEEAWHIIANWKKTECVKPEEKHWYNIFKSQLLYYMGKFQESLKIAEKEI